jgi:hypothetical protein
VVFHGHCHQKAEAGTAATGTSCREQIHHGTQRSAWHPIELVLQAAGMEETPNGTGPAR